MNSESKFNALLLKILSAIVVISLSLNGIMLINRSETFPRKKYLMGENSKLRQQINKANVEIKKFKGISEKIDLIVRDAESRMQDKEKHISELLRSKKLKDQDYENLIDEIDSLKEEYLSSIDSLLVERERNRVLSQSLENMSTEVADLKSQLEIARELQSENIYVEGIKLNRQKKGQNTALAKKSDQLKLCFDILPNRLSMKGDKDINIIITGPDGIIIKDAELSEIEFKHPEYNKTARLSKREVIDYQNERLVFCSTITPSDKLIPGLYLAEVFGSDYKLGMITFILR